MSCVITNASLWLAARRLSVSGFVALALMLAACGGGGGSESSRLDSKSPYTEKPTSGNGGTQDSAGDDDQEPVAEAPETDADADAPAVETPSAEAPDENSSPDSGGDSGEGAPNPDTATPDPDDGAVVDGGGSEPDAGAEEPDTGAEEPTAGEDSGLVEDVVSEVSGLVRLEWDRPEFRENGEYLEADEIGGYELRYRQVGQEEFETVIVNDGWDEDHELGELVGRYEFTIAAFDNNGLYSEFVNLAPATGLVGSL